MGSFKKSRFLKNARGTTEMSLNITAMADIFTVLLVFLLMGYGSGAMDIQPSAGLQLPSAGAAAGDSAALKLEISRTAVQVETKPVATLQDGRFASGEVQPDGTARAVSEAIKLERARQIALAQANPDVKLDARVIVIADEKTPYATIKSVLATVAVQGYTDFKLAVVSKGQ